MKDANLGTTNYIDHEEPAIVNKVKELTAGCESEEEKLQAIFYFVRDEIPYNMYTVSGNTEDYKASRILAAGKGFCIQKAILFTALSRAAGIPSRLVIVAIRNHLISPEVVELLGGNLFFPHGYSQVWLNDRWVNIAATFDQPLCERMGAAAADFDGQNDTLLPKTDLKGNPFIEYIDHHGIYADLPWDYIMEKMSVYYDERWQIWFGDEMEALRQKYDGTRTDQNKQ